MRLRVKRHKGDKLTVAQKAERVRNAELEFCMNIQETTGVRVIQGPGPFLHFNEDGSHFCKVCKCAEEEVTIVDEVKRVGQLKFLHEEDCPVPDIMDRGYAALYDGLGPGDPTFDGIRGEMQALLLDKSGASD